MGQDRTVQEVAEEVGRRFFGAIIESCSGDRTIYEFKVHPREIPLPDLTSGEKLVHSMGPLPLDKLREEADDVATKKGLPRVGGLHSQ